MRKKRQRKNIIKTESEGERENAMKRRKQHQHQRQKRINEWNAFIYIITYSFFYTFVLFWRHHHTHVLDKLLLLFLFILAHTHTHTDSPVRSYFLYILTNEFLFDSIFTNHVSIYKHIMFVYVCLIFIASAFRCSRLPILEFEMNLCMQHPSYFCSSSSEAHTRPRTTRKTTIPNELKWNDRKDRMKCQLFKKKWHFVGKYWNALD